MTVKLGLCGYTISAARYAQHFPVVEVQQTFYQPPTTAVLDRWRAQQPAAFEFTIKAWQLITHTAASPTYRRLKRELTPTERAGAGRFSDAPIVDEAWDVTVACAARLRATAILLQCPASFTPTPDNLARLRSFVERITRRGARPAGVRLMFEPRGPAWTAALARPVCEALDLLHVVDPFVSTTTTSDTGVTYFRLHGHGPDRARHVYTDGELAALAGMVPPTGETYVMFNNIPRVADAARFAQLLGRQAA